MADDFAEPMVTLSRANSLEEDFDYDEGVHRNSSSCTEDILGYDDWLLDQNDSSSPVSFSRWHQGECEPNTRTLDLQANGVEESGDSDTTTKLRQGRILSSSSSSSTKRWGMGHRSDSRLIRSYDNAIGRQRGSNKPELFDKLLRLSESGDYRKATPFSIGTEVDVDRSDSLSDTSGGLSTFDENGPSSDSSRPRAGYTAKTTAIRRFSFIGCLLILLVEFTCYGSAYSPSCVQEECALEFTRALDHDKVLQGANLPFCVLLGNYRSCLNRTSRACRGDLKYHSLNTMVMTQFRDFNCSAVIEHRRKFGTLPSKVISGKSARSNLTLEPPDDDGVNGDVSNSGRCLFPYQHQKGSGGYRYCSVFGDPHLRTFEGQYETCRTLGAWPLIDNSYFGVQVTNDPVADGVDASGISKVTVIVKSLPGCTDQKMFEATRDFLPSSFVDGTTNSGDPSTNSISGASYYIGSSFDNRGAEGEHRPAVMVRTIDSDRHVEIHLRYISTRVVIRRVGNYLTVAIKIPEEVLVQRTSLNSLQLCLTGCPSSELINYKEVLAYPAYYVKKWGARNPAMSREQAVDICRQAGVTDFFFDSCVFDLLMTGEESFKESASAAMQDIRQLYPPYRKHYETRRSDLQLYDELAKMGRDLEHEEREHGHKRRQPGRPYWDAEHQQDDEPFDDSVSGAKARMSRTNSGCGSRTVPINLLLLGLLLISAYISRYSRRW